MKEFPNILNVKNKDSFPEIHYNRVMCYLRKSIYEHVINHDENSYFDLDQVGRLHLSDQKNREELIASLCTAIRSELKKLGWKCKCSFGGTALFIFSSENPPSSCWDDGLTDP
jgi:hypothetical protein